MLSEPECRVLSSAFDVMLMDFDPKDAVIFLESSGLLTEHLAEKIEAKVGHLPILLHFWNESFYFEGREAKLATRLERLRELLRIYRRRATDCEPLISYFEFAGQEHIAKSLRLDLDHILDGYSKPDIPRFPHHLRLRKLLAGGVPRVWQHVRREYLMNEVAKILRERADLDSFFVVLHGIAGCGKSSLAAVLFAVVPDILGNCFDSVIWLRDSSKEPNQARYLFADLLLMLWEDITVDPPKLDDVSSVYLRKQVQEALIDRPNVIIILDDVVQKETVMWANQLGLRVLATTRNASLFASASCSVDIITVPGFTTAESTEFFSTDESRFQRDDSSTRSALSSAFSVSSGNIALLGMLKKLAAGRTDRLSISCRRLAERGLSSVTAATSYEFDSMYCALTASVECLPPCDRDTLACAVVLPSEEDIPLAIWALVIPVDMAGSDENEFMMLLSDRLSRLCDNGNWLSHDCQNDTFRISRMVELYLRETVEEETVKALISTLKYRLERGAVENPVIRDFFSKHSPFYKDVHGMCV